MSYEAALDEMLSRWHSGYQRGEVVPPESLCRAWPELLPELQRRIALFGQAERLERPGRPAEGAQAGGSLAVPDHQVLRELGPGGRGVVHDDALPADQVTLTPAPPSETATVPSAGGTASPPAAPDDVSPPGYEVLETLGKGGMGVIYKARQKGFDRVVALKMILAGAHADQADRERFRTEGEAIARLHHPGIVQVYEVGEHRGLPYFSLEFCAGGSLEKKLSGTPLLPAEAAALVETLAQAMQAAHEARIIHRDLKPANVLLTEDGSPRITDFGLAKKLDAIGQTTTGAVMGTPSYMAPEQAEGKKDVGPLADVYALGAILYECLTGRPPFKTATMMDTLMQVVSDEPVPPSQLQSKVPQDLETICLKCLQKEPRKRYGSAKQLAEDLRRFQARESIMARPVRRVEHVVKWVKRRPLVAGLLATVVLLTAGGLIGVSWALGVALDERDRAREQEKRANEQKEKADQERERAARARDLADERKNQTQEILQIALDEVRQNVAVVSVGRREQASSALAGHVLFKMACSYARASKALGDNDRLDPSDRVRLSTEYASQAMNLLVSAKGLGYFHDSENREALTRRPDFDGLRGREDFQRLLTDPKSPGGGRRE